jgi:hypothetical protein
LFIEPLNSNCPTAAKSEPKTSYRRLVIASFFAGEEKPSPVV